jgi:hypothetical protein
LSNVRLANLLGDNFTNILRSAYPPILLRQKSQNVKVQIGCANNYCMKKAAQEMLVKLTKGVNPTKLFLRKRDIF